MAFLDSHGLGTLWTKIKTTFGTKTTSISSSSTDNEYPSAKCVYDIVGDIETLLNEINSGGGA